MRAVSGVVIVAGILLAACGSDGPSEPPGDSLRFGTWGGDSAGILVSDTLAHVHIKCTYGDFVAPVRLNASGEFSVTGSYLLRAYPVAVGPTMPAIFAGRLDGDEVIATVVVMDTVEARVVTFGPVRLKFNREPQLRMCPICQVPGMRPDLPVYDVAAQDVFFGIASLAASARRLRPNQLTAKMTAMPATAPMPSRNRHAPPRPGSP